VKQVFPAERDEQKRIGMKKRNAMTKAERNDKIGKQKPRKSLIADGDFVNDLMKIGYFGPRKRRVPPLVGLDIKHLKPISLPSTHHELPRKALKAWRDTGTAIKGLFLHEALASEPSVKAFTLMLSMDVEKHVRALGKHGLAWLHRRVVRQLRPLRDLCRAGAVPFVFVLEESRRMSRRARLHIHGEISMGPSVSERDVEKFRAALKRAGGNWVPEYDDDKVPVKFTSAPDIGWMGYSLKNLNKPGLKFLRRYGVESDRRYVHGFEGKALTASEDLQRRAALMHAEAVKLVWHVR
jgi:hypothetical protein